MKAIHILIAILMHTVVVTGQSSAGLIAHLAGAQNQPQANKRKKGGLGR